MHSVYKSFYYPGIIVLLLVCQGSQIDSRVFPVLGVGNPISISTSIEFLPSLPTGYRAGMTSSYDPKGLNDDGFSGLETFLYRENNEWVLFDQKGRGQITHMLFNSPAHLPSPRTQPPNVLNQPIRIYIDNNPVPMFDGRAGDLFVSTINPLGGYASGGFYSYMPISFNTRCKITAYNTPEYREPPYFYEFSFINGLKPDFTSQWISAFRNAGTYPHNLSQNWQGPLDFNISANSEITIANLNGPAMITGFRAMVTDPSFWKHLRVKIFWDRSATPSVDCPLGALFGSFDAVYPIRSVLFKLDGLNLTSGECWWPMPYNKNAIIKLVNNSNQDTTLVVDISKTDGIYPLPYGYFNAIYNESLPTALFVDHVVLQTSGTGKFVGMVQEHELNMGIPFWSFEYFEGDERVYVDDSKSPQFHGIGGEDTFNLGWYGLAQRTTLATHGFSGEVVRQQPTLALFRSMYRLYLSDDIPFYKSLKFTQEHGGYGEHNANYRSVAFFYKKPNESLALVDTIDVGDTQSEILHSYAKGTLSQPIALSSRYVGQFGPDFFGQFVADNGYNIDNYVQFTVNIPAQNQGIVIRCRKDRETGPREARVFVNDVPMNENWYDPTSNRYLHNRWHDEEYVIPLQYTQGRTSLTIKLELTPQTAGRWREFKYLVYSYRFN
ncbi:MAG: DUF2961 domain-containing protein [Planctomycetes bacterium]|nr:DUF2961 domain-containing protein [Planctomycetota bacterium]